MIDRTKIEPLARIGEQVKALLPDVDGQVIFNLSRSKEKTKAKVTVIVADVTGVRK